MYTTDQNSLVSSYIHCFHCFTKTLQFLLEIIPSIIIPDYRVFWNPSWAQLSAMSATAKYLF